MIKSPGVLVVLLFSLLTLVLCLLCPFLLGMSCRVLEQHKLTKEQWEDRIQTWHEEHRSMLR